jgi:NADPH-dependent curcumin reductase CurA
LVSTAAGAVGSLVGQIGKHLGCRTIGLTSNEEKIQRCVEEYGYDYALNFREGDLAQAVAAAAPEGVDIFYDNTGGTILDTVLRQMRIGGRIVQCGTASIATWNPAPTGPRNEREVLTRRLSWGGFVIFDHAARYRQAAQQLVDWYNDGQIRCATDIATGIEHAPGAIADLYASKNSGKRLVLIS